MSSRLDLFQKTSRQQENISTRRSASQSSQQLPEDKVDLIQENDVKLYQDYGLGKPDDSPLQLEKVIGYSGNFLNTVQMTSNEDIFVRSLGCLVSIENLADNTQRCLRGHDMTVSAIAVSLSGNLIASGQIGTKNFKGFSAPIFVWHFSSGKRVQVLKGLTIKVNLITFSNDERFICGSGEDSLIFIWDIATTEIVYTNRFASPITVFSWVFDAYKGHDPNLYEVIYGVGNALNKANLVYDPTRVQWSMKPTVFALTPHVNMIRIHLCIQITLDTLFVLIGSTTGEILVFRRDTSVFRTSIPVCSNGVQALLMLPDSCIICGGGDGTIKKLKGNDMSWSVINERVLDSSIKSLSLSPNHTEFIAACSSGSIYRCLVSNFTNTIVVLSHTAVLNTISFSYDIKYPSNLFATGSADGELRVWDILDYNCTSILKLQRSGSINSVKLIRGEFVISGCEDGFIRCHDVSLNRQLWIIANAHRGSIMSIDYHMSDISQYVISGGMDCTLRVWKWSTRELITQYTEHKKGIAKVSVDINNANLIHSIGYDSTVLTYDLKTSRRIINHIVTGGSAMNDFTQRKDSENELITCDTYGRLLFWDIDYRDPVQAVQDPSRLVLKCCAISPSSKYLAFGGEDELLKVLDLSSGRITALGQGHSGSLLTVAWTSDGRQILTSATDGCLCIWNFFSV